MALVVASNVAALNTYNTLKKMIKRWPVIRTVRWC